MSNPLRHLQFCHTAHYKQDLFAIVERFVKKGWYPVEVEGVFAHAIVFSPDKKMVLKIASDLGWKNFIRWAAKPRQQRNPHIPKIYAMREIEYGVDDKGKPQNSMICCVMERLFPSEHYWKEDQIQAILDASYDSPDKMPSEYDGVQIPKTYCNIYNRMTKELGCVPGDLHSGNLMVRLPTKHVVIIDPYGHSY